MIMQCKRICKDSELKQSAYSSRAVDSPLVYCKQGVQGPCTHLSGCEKLTTSLRLLSDHKMSRFEARFWPGQDGGQAVNLCWQAGPGVANVRGRCVAKPVGCVHRWCRRFPVVLPEGALISCGTQTFIERERERENFTSPFSQHWLMRTRLCWSHQPH